MAGAGGPKHLGGSATRTARTERGTGQSMMACTLAESMVTPDAEMVWPR